jgi:hypothetical protein
VRRHRRRMTAPPLPLARLYEATSPLNRFNSVGGSVVNCGWRQVRLHRVRRLRKRIEVIAATVVFNVEERRRRRRAHWNVALFTSASCQQFRSTFKQGLLLLLTRCRRAATSRRRGGGTGRSMRPPTAVRRLGNGRRPVLRAQGVRVRVCDCRHFTYFLGCPGCRFVSSTRQIRVQTTKRPESRRRL